MLQDLRSRYDCHLVIVNGENAAGGLGITKPTAAALFGAGADVITLGNHTFAKRDVASYLAEEPRILRPANYPPSVPGFGWGIYEAATGDKVAVISLMGRTFMEPLDCPFRKADEVLAQIGDSARTIVVDIHAEASSEKVAMGCYLDGRVSAVLGTHTHIQTSDQRVLPGGTAYITDVGMTGVVDSVLGMSTQAVLSRFLTQVPTKFELAEGATALHGVVLEISARSGRAVSIERVAEPEN